MNRKIRRSNVKPERLKIQVFGRVQDVGYRYFAKETAGECGISGWVKNLHNGTVEIEAEGQKENLEVFKGILRRGCYGSIVSDMVTEKITPIKDSIFSIKYYYFGN